MKKITLNGETMNISKEKYLNNGTPAITIFCKENSHVSPFIDLTTNFDGASRLLEENEIAVKTWSENEPFIKEILASGYFEDTGKRIPISDWVQVQVWKMVKEISGDGEWTEE